MRGFARIVGALLIALCVSACGTSVQTNVTRFNTLPPTGTGETFYMSPGKDQQGSLEYASYANHVAEKLSTYGYRQVQDIREAKYSVVISYAIDNGTTSTTAMPLYGQTGGGMTTYTGNTYGNVGGMPYSGMSSGYSYTPPTYGEIGSIPVTTTTYQRAVVVGIVDLEKSSPNNPVLVFEGKARSVGTSGSLAVVMPAMVEAVFKGFPGKNGETYSTKTPLRKR